MRSPPPAVATINRANRAGKPLMYCTTAWEAALAECRVQPEDFVTVSEWELTARCIVNHVGMTSETFKHLGAKRPSMWTHLDLEIADFLSAQFRGVVGADEKHLYKITIAVAEEHIPDTSPYMHALVYPCMPLSGNFENIAFRPEYAREHLKCVAAEVVGIKNAAPPIYDYFPLAKAASISDTGDISWDADPVFLWDAMIKMGINTRVRFSM